MKNAYLILRVLIILLFIVQGCKTFVTSDGTNIDQQGSKEVQEKPLQSPNNEDKFVKGELIVRFKDAVANREMEKIISSIGAKTIKIVSKERKTVLILLPKNLSIQDAINKLSKLPEILYVEPNRIYRLEGE